MVLNRRDCIVIAAAAASVGFCGPGVLAQTSSLPAHGKGKDAPATTIVVVGDSLSAEYGLRRGTGWVALLEEKLKQESIPAEVINASVSGDTSSGGRARLPALLAQHRPTHVIIELGGNDALRGLSLQATQDNLNQMTRAAQKAGAKVVLVGMQVPPNYGAAYGEQFAKLFGQVAQANKAALVPFLLKGVADGDDPTRLFQNDRIHPLAEAHPMMLANVWPTLRKLLP
jgi:acyl-CoA thioesterase I